LIGALIALSLVVGALIGAVGIGGILLVPGLVVLGRLTIHVASATALFSFLFTGVLSTWLFARRGSLDVRASAWVCAGAVLSSFAGAYVNSLTNAALLARIIGSVITLAGINVLYPLRRANVAEQRSRSSGVLFGVGVAAGFGSGLTGAGGPLFSVPIMLGLGFPPLMTIGVSQVLQVISAVSGTIANLAYGALDFHAAVWIVPAQLVGVALGVAVAHRANVAQLRGAAGWLCVVSGAFILLRGV
jgi:uncharacterized protein